MVEKGEKKILAIVTIIIVLISIGFSGCVEEEKDEGENDKIKDAESNDLQLEIEQYKDFEPVNKVHTNDSYFDLFIKLINIDNNPIKIDWWFHLGSNVHGKMIGPNNETYTISTKISPDIVHNIVTLKPGEYLESGIAGNVLIINETLKNRWNGTPIGKYQIQCWYVDIDPWVYSNIIYFDVVK